MKVYQAINKVQSALSKQGIAKEHKNQQQGYKFRGIDDIYGALSPLLAEYGLCILPKACERVVTEKASKSGGILFYVAVRVEFSFVCAEDGSSHVVSMYGEAMDSGDKATNKAMSAAYKYACLQTFCIPTEGDNDADAHTPEPVVINKSYEVMGGTTKEHVLEVIKAAGISPQVCRQWCAKYGVERLSHLNDTQLKEIMQEIADAR